jgi:phenylacetate-CoA ligase
MRTNYENMKARDPGNSLWVKSTGGSTGEPLHFAYTRESFEWRVAMSLRGYGWAGAPPGSKQAYVWGVATTPPSTLGKLKERLHHFVERKRYFNCFDFDSDAMLHCLDVLERWQPDAIVGYTNPLYELARFSLQNSRAIEVPNVLCAAEKVHPVQREAMQEAFGCAVFDTYGSREFMLIASECEAHSGLHVSMENLIVEVVDESGKPVPSGEVGRLLITDLHNYGMPFIRYEIGDLARASNRQCTCGRGLGMIEDVVGRSLDVIRTPSGRVVPGEFFPHLMKDYAAIRRFQVIQEELDALTVLLQGHTTIPAETIDRIEAQIKQTLAEPMRLQLKAVDEIPLNRTGKHRVTVSRLGDAAK